MFIPICWNIGQFFHFVSPRSISNHLLPFLPADGLYALSFSISSLTLIGMLAVITYTVSWDQRQLFNVASCEHWSYICTVINACFKQDYCQIPLSKKINDTTKMLLETKRGSFFRFKLEDVIECGWNWMFIAWFILSCSDLSKGFLVSLLPSDCRSLKFTRASMCSSCYLTPRLLRDESTPFPDLSATYLLLFVDSLYRSTSLSIKKLLHFDFVSIQFLSLFSLQNYKRSPHLSS